MNRILVLIFSDGGRDHYLDGVHVDKQNYLNFFKSPEGGAWMDNEILLYDHNNFDIEKLRERDLSARTELHPIDFYFVVFCGHGFTDQHGQIHLVVRTDCDLLLDDLTATICHSRYLIIADSCRALSKLEEGGRLNALRIFSIGENARQSTYANLCRDMYNKLLEHTPHNMHMVLFSNSFNETAGENKGFGGYYSFALMQSAKDMIHEIRKVQDHTIHSYEVTMDTIHQMAVNKVVLQTHDTQHPEIFENSRSKARFPFLVVPHLQLQFVEE